MVKAAMAAILWAAVSLLSACASQSPSPEEERQVNGSRVHYRPAVKTVAPAQITVIRDVGFIAGGVLFHISIDGQRIVSLDQGERFDFAIDPGEYQLSVIPTQQLFADRKPTVLEVTWKPGQRATYRAGSDGNYAITLTRDVSKEQSNNKSSRTDPYGE